MWIAKYSDGTELHEIDEQQHEHLFGEIDQDKLVRFIIRSNGRELHLDLKTGIIWLDGMKRLNFGFQQDKKRLIYFKRHRKYIGPNNPGPQVVEFLGWQATVEGKNVKRILGLHPDQITIQCD